MHIIATVCVCVCAYNCNDPCAQTNYIRHARLFTLLPNYLFSSCPFIDLNKHTSGVSLKHLQVQLVEPVTVMMYVQILPSPVVLDRSVRVMQATRTTALETSV